MLHTRHYLNTIVSRRTSGRSLRAFMAKQSSIASQNCSRVGSLATLPTELSVRCNSTTAAISWLGQLSGDRCVRNSPHWRHKQQDSAEHQYDVPVWGPSAARLIGGTTPPWSCCGEGVAGHVDCMKEGEKYLRGFGVETWRKATSRKTKA
jgi:hypothetical protein